MAVLDLTDGTLTIDGWTDFGDGTGFYPPEYDLGDGDEGTYTTFTVGRAPSLTLTVSRTLPSFTVAHAPVPTFTVGAANR